MDEKEVSAAARAKREKTREKKKNPVISAVLALIATLLLVALAVLAFVFRDRLTGEGLREMFRSGPAETAQGESFVYESGADQVFAAAGSGLAMASSSSIELMNAAGNTVFKQVVSYGVPAVFACERGALFCSLGGTECVLASMDAETEPLRIVPGGEIITASMNAAGWFTVTATAAGYKGLVGVYDAAGTLKYQWWSGNGYVLKAAVSPDNRMLAVLCAETGGGRLHLFRLDSELEQGAAEFQSELPFDLEFLGNDRICVVGEDALSFFAADGELKGRFELGNYYLLDYNLSGQSYAALYVSAYRTGSGGLIETVDRDGKLLGYAETGQNVTSLSASGRQLLVMTAGGLTLYGQDMSVLGGRDSLMTAKRAILRPDGDVLLLNAYSAERIRL